MADEILRIECISAGYGPVTVLREVSITVDRGETVTLIGANGAGKTTTLLCCSGIIPITSGRVIFDGKDISEFPAHARVGLGLAQVPEGRKIFPRLTVHENLEMGAYLRSDGTAIAQDLQRVYSLFPVLAERRTQAGGTLSGGEQQMLAIGRALMSSPRMLLLDEPSMGISPILSEKIFAALRELCAEGLTLLLVEQNAAMALSLATRGYVIETGRIILKDSASNLLTNSNVQLAYLGGQ